MMKQHKNPKIDKDTITTSLSLDTSVVELIKKWQYITGLTRNEILNAVSVWLLIREGAEISDLDTINLKQLQHFIDKLGLEGVNLKYRAFLGTLIKLRINNEKAFSNDNEELMNCIAKHLRENELFTPYTPKNLKDLKRVEGEVADELLREFPNLQILLA